MARADNNMESGDSGYYWSKPVYSDMRSIPGYPPGKMESYPSVMSASKVESKNPCNELNRKQRRNQEKQERRRNKKFKDQTSNNPNPSCSTYQQNFGKVENRLQPFYEHQKVQPSSWVTQSCWRTLNYDLAGFAIPLNIPTGVDKVFSRLQLETLVKLQKVHLHKISFEIDMNYFVAHFLNDTNGPKPADFLLTNNLVSFESVEQLEKLRLQLKEYTGSKRRFRLNIEDCICRIGSKYDGNSTLVLMMALSSNNPMKEIISVAECFEIEESRIEIFHFFGKVRKIMLAGILFGQSCNANLCLCVIWKWENASFIDWSELTLRCNQNCFDCSSLLLLIGLRKNLQRKFTLLNVNFGRRRFFPSKFHRLSQTIEKLETPESPFKRPALINVQSVELFFGQSFPFTTNPDVISRSLKQLECFDMIFGKVTLQVEVDSNGWGFMRINLTTSPLEVKFSNGVSVEWEANSTEKPRLVAIETRNIPQKEVDLICALKNEKQCFVSPLLYIDQEFDVPFLCPVKVQMPFSGSESLNGNACENFDLKVYSKHGFGNSIWTLIPDSSVKRFANYFTYHSTVFSPVISVASEDENLMQAENFVGNNQPIYLTVCPLPEREKVNFDCRRLNEAERLEVLRKKEAEIKAIVDMKTGDIVHGEIHGNLEIDERYGYKLGEDKRLVFKYPKTGTVPMGNNQTYIMRLKDPNWYPEATITYYRVGTNEEKEDEKLCQLSVQILKNNSQIEVSENVLKYEQLKNILETCKLQWSGLLRHLSKEATEINKIKKHNCGDVLLNLGSELNSREKGKDLIQRLFKCAQIPHLETAALLNEIEAKFGHDGNEAYYQLCLAWMERAPCQFQEVDNVKLCLEEMGLQGLVSSIAVISRGACDLACKEIWRTIDKTDRREMVKEIAKFLKNQDDPDCQNLAFDMLLRL